MTPREAEAAVAGRRAGGIKPGLARMEQGLALLGHPEEALRVVHIAGTNGKGSTARMIQAAATACGVRTGLYTSPAVTCGTPSRWTASPFPEKRSLRWPRN